jgi:hypothetical protein
MRCIKNRCTLVVFNYILANVTSVTGLIEWLLVVVEATLVKPSLNGIRINWSRQQCCVHSTFGQLVISFQCEYTIAGWMEINWS